jgi:hypothetical protein
VARLASPSVVYPQLKVPRQANEQERRIPRI